MCVCMLAIVGQFLQGEVCFQAQSCTGLSATHSKEKGKVLDCRFLHLCNEYGLVPLEAGLGRALDSQTKRELKIQRFQKEKLGRVRLSKMLARNSGDLESGEENEDGDLEREAWLLKIELSVLKAAEQRSQIKQVCHLPAQALDPLAYKQPLQ